MQILALTGQAARRWEPNRLRLIPARYALTGRRRLLHLAATAPFTALALSRTHRPRAADRATQTGAGLTRRTPSRRPQQPPASGTGATRANRANRHTHMPIIRHRGNRAPPPAQMIMAVEGRG